MTWTPTDTRPPMETLSDPQRPVLAVLTEHDDPDPVLDRAAAAADALGAPLRLLLLVRRSGPSTDPALMAHLAARRQDQLASLLALAGRRFPGRRLLGGRLVGYAVQPWHDARRRAWRAVTRAAEREGACLVVAPDRLAARTADGLATVAVDTDRLSPSRG